MSEQMLKSSLISRRNEERVIKAQYYMLKNIDKQFPGIEYLSQYCGISSSLFKRSFKEVTGYTSYNFFIENKLFKAKELLEESDLSIATISNELNFSNPSYFSIMFKKNLECFLNTTGNKFQLLYYGIFEQALIKFKL